MGDSAGGPARVFGVCPLMSLTEPLKQIGDYPKCSGVKCAWWSESCHKCFVVALAETLDLHDCSEPLRQIETYVETALSPYGSTSNGLTRAIQALEKLGEFVQANGASLADIIQDLAAIMKDRRNNGPS